MKRGQNLSPTIIGLLGDGLRRFRKHQDKLDSGTSILFRPLLVPSLVFWNSIEMASLGTVSADKPKNDKNTLALKKNNEAWKGNSVSAATAAALESVRDHDVF